MTKHDLLRVFMLSNVLKRALLDERAVARDDVFECARLAGLQSREQRI